jgi:ATP-dependent RNA helicase DeaD
MQSDTISNQPENTPDGEGRRRRPSALHEATCANCGTLTMLPFEPTAERPGYCLSCYSERNAGGRAKAQGAETRPFNKPVRQQPVREERSERQASPKPIAAQAERSPRREQPARQAPRTEQASDTSHAEVFAGIDIQGRTRSALSRMGITSPTPIQEQTIPWLNQGRDVVGQAMTGSGKTLAFGIPLVEGCDSSARGVQGLVLVPTRELAIQVASVLDAVSEGRVSVMLLYGGRPVGAEKRALVKGAQIIVGTPGRTLDHLRQGNLALGSVRMMVLDEADEMLDRGFARDVESIIAATPAKRQTALFSATLPDWVADTARKHLRDPKTVQVAIAEGEGLKIEHLIYRIDKETRLSALRTLLDQRDGAPIIVFGKTKHGVKKLAKQLVDLGYPVGPLQGNMSQNAREKVMADFRSGAAPVLVATNVAARGLDVEGIAQVINYDLPDSLQLFTHRVGRTGRMGKAGEAITFVTPDDDKKWRELERGFDFTFTIKRWGDSGAGTSQEPARQSRPAAQRPAAPARQTAPQRPPQQRSAGDRQAPQRSNSPRPAQQRSGQGRNDGAQRDRRDSRDAPQRSNSRPQSSPDPRSQRQIDLASTPSRDTVQADTPQLEAERQDMARSTHTPPPNGGQPKRKSPWLRFGRRD